MITAMGEENDKVTGFDTGADEYMTKPISLAELLARLRSIERRIDTASNENIITKGSVKLNISQQELSATNSIILAGKETKLMEILMLNKKISTDYIYNQIWSNDEDSDKGYVWIYISYLRQKLKAINANLEIIGEENSDFELIEV
jgi:DNA-binding response regulator